MGLFVLEQPEDVLIDVKPTYEELDPRVRELEEKVTAGQQMQKELRESEARFKTMFDNAPEAIMPLLFDFFDCCLHRKILKISNLKNGITNGGRSY